MEPPRAPCVRFVIGARIRWCYATAPWGRLRATAEEIVVTASFDRAVLAREHVLGIYSRRWLVRTVILFRTDDGSGDFVSAYPLRPRKLLRALKRLGWPVEDHI